MLTTSDGTRTITSGGIDDFGRATTYTDADGGQTVTAFDPTTGRATSVTVKRPDGTTLGTTTYAYGTSTDFRGLPSQVTHSELSGAITGVYNADGNLVEQQVPATVGNLKQVWEFATTLNDTAITSGTATGSPEGATVSATDGHHRPSGSNRAVSGSVETRVLVSSVGWAGSHSSALHMTWPRRTAQRSVRRDILRPRGVNTCA